MQFRLSAELPICALDLRREIVQPLRMADDGEGVQFISGRVEGCSVRSVISGAAVVFEELPFVLVTSIDSAVDLRQVEVSRLMSRGLVGVNVGFVGDEARTGLLVAGAELLRWAEFDDLLVGFDEIWLFDAAPKTVPPLGCSLCEPVRLDEHEPSDEIISWMHQSGCLVGLGDGYGTNFIASDAAIAAALHLVKA